MQLYVYINDVIENVAYSVCLIIVMCYTFHWLWGGGVAFVPGLVRKPS